MTHPIPTADRPRPFTIVVHRCPKCRKLSSNDAFDLQRAAPGTAIRTIERPCSRCVPELRFPKHHEDKVR